MTSEQIETSSFDKFNAKSYLNRNYRVRHDGIPDSPEDWMPWLLKNLKDTFAGGKLSGSLLDVGTGPAIHNLISAARYFRNITCAEFCQENREEVERWIRGDKDAFDWDPFIKYVCGLEGEGSDWEARKEALRDAIQYVVFCDVREKKPLGGFHSGPYDVVSSILALCGAAKDKADFDAIVSHVGSLVKPGGTLILLCDLDSTYSTDGAITYPHIHLDASYIRQAVRDSGFTDVEDNILVFGSTEGLKGWEGTSLIYLTARRCSE